MKQTEKDWARAKLRALLALIARKLDTQAELHQRVARELRAW